MKQSSIVHNGFLDKLSYDIISNIFLYLDQKDCVNCMATCPEWYDRIPQFTQANWETLRLNSDGISQYQERNLGKHVKHVKFDDVPEGVLSTMMKKLLDCECTKIESLEFYCCTSAKTEEQQNMFLNQLRQLASYRLTHLNMKCENYDFSVLDLIFVCPHLTHFSYHSVMVFPSRDYRDKPLQILPSDQTLYNTLIYLHMDTVTPTIQYQAQSIIYRTPNLRYFIGASKQLGAKNDRTLIPPDFVLSWCPKLEYYVGDGSYNNGEDFIRDAFTQSSTLLSSAATTTNSHSNNNNNSDNQQRAFQYFCVGNVCDTGQIISVLRKYKDTLKHLKIAQSSDRRHIFQAIPMQQLCTLYCNNINYSMKSIVTLLNSCRNTIQEVQLQHDTEPHILDLLTLQSLQKLPQLRALTIKRVAFTDENSVVTLLTQLPLLENLILEEEKLVTLPEEAAPLSENLRRLTPVETHIISNEDESLLEGPNFFAPLSQCGPNLESVTLKCHGDIGIQFTMLDALAALPSLKSLDVEFIGNYQNQGFHEEKEEQQMLKFLNSFLHRCDNDMNNNITTITSPPKIEKMTLYGVSKLTYNILNILGDFTNLQDFTVLLSGPFPGNRERVVSSDSPLCNVDLSGVWELLRKSKKLKRILFMRMILLGEGIPSIYLTKKLAEQQQDDFQLRKYVVKPGNNQPLFRGKMVIQQIVKIINMDYQ